LGKNVAGHDSVIAAGDNGVAIMSSDVASRDNAGEEEGEAPSVGASPSFF
jgi:hypothetical protein